MKRIVISITALLLVQGTASLAEDKAVRKELEANYAVIARADHDNNAKALVAKLTPDFRHNYPLLKYETPESIINEFSMRSKTDPVRTLTYTIGAITLHGNTATANVTESIVWYNRADNGGRDKIEKILKLRSTWTRTKQGWRLQREDELEESRMFENGKPLQ